ncbi:hypothetical protein [uncultured Gulosibacter sp.]|uniref:hypothetical protein n=1 Tax=uncultured Gulosibacter sp. TaxID=1339167 RepID=UPI0028890A2F|nr:hypothetical protein [uncultured Gulosibacter sp.]
MVSWAEVRMWQSAPLEELIADIRHDERAAQEQSEVLDDGIDAIISTGETADAARETLAKMRDAADKLEGLLTDYLAATQSAAASVRSIADRVQNCYDYAQTHDLVLTDDGSVLLGPEVFVRAQVELEIAQNLFDPNARLEERPSFVAAKRAQAELERNIAEVLETANSVDRAYANALERISEGEVSDGAWLAATANGDAIDPTELWGDATSPAEVRAEWDALSPAEQAALIEQYPEFIGQLNGVPFDRRVEANDINIARTRDLAQSELAELRAELNDSRPWQLVRKKQLNEEIAALEREIAYYDALIDGPGAVLFDRANDRIIEVVGDINDPNLKDVLTYVAPTSGQWSNFVDGEMQLVTRDQVERGAQLNNPTAGFVYKDGPWVEWLFTDRGNANNEFLGKAGAGLADFQEALRLEEFAHRADINIAGHSAGHSVVAASETHGARYDQVFSLAGSYMPAGWEPTIGTQYDHMTYGYDAIHVLDNYRDFAREHDGLLNGLGWGSSAAGSGLSTAGGWLSDKGQGFDAWLLDDAMRSVGDWMSGKGTYLENMGRGFDAGADLMADTPNSSSAYEKHSFEAQYRSDDQFRVRPFGQLGGSFPIGPIDSHWRVSQGAERNGPVLEAMFSKLIEN